MKLNFQKPELSGTEIEYLEKLSLQCRGDILAMTTLAQSGHPGGSMSSIDIYSVLWSCCNVFPDNPHHPERDRIIISHGHTSPAAYSILGRLGFFDVEKAISLFRKAGSIFEGHVERDVPGIEWGTGNLGQGLSCACGMAMCAKVQKKDFRVYAVMGDGEQQKGQISEARRFASRYQLGNLTVIIDYNQLQISGSIHDVMPQDLISEYQADGFKVVKINGHSFSEIYSALRESRNSDRPVLILAHTVMGKGVSFMENRHQYHGKPLSADELKNACAELGLVIDLEKFKKSRAEFKPQFCRNVPVNPPSAVKCSSFRTYTEKTDNRSAFGNALCDIAKAAESQNRVLAVIDCDLAASVKTDGLKKDHPSCFIQSGISEHHAAVFSGAMASQGILTFWADFGVFGVDETFNQARLNDINRAGVKIACTHCGLDVGEDGKTHQCIDYTGLFRNLPHFSLIVPADPSQTDRAVKYAAATEGNFLLIMGRSKVPNITGSSGKPFFGDDYQYQYGMIDRIYSDSQPEVAVFGVGQMISSALEAGKKLGEEKISHAVLSVSSPLKTDEKMLQELKNCRVWAVVEDHFSDSGFAATLALFMVRNKISAKLVSCGISDYSFSGDSAELYHAEGLDGESVFNRIKDEM